MLTVRRRFRRMLCGALSVADLPPLKRALCRASDGAAEYSAAAEMIILPKWRMLVEWNPSVRNKMILD